MPKLAHRLGAITAIVAFGAPFHAASNDLPPLDTWRFSLPLETLHVTGAHDLGALFTAKDYRLGTVAAERKIPRLYLRHLIDDLRKVEPVQDREALFIRIVLPLVARANAEILAQRALLHSIMAAQARGGDIPPAQSAWLAALAEQYGGTGADTADLLHRVDVVPPSLAIAQAIDESGWGTAHLALQSNGMFGQHAPPGLGRGSLHVTGTKVDVAAFPSLLDGVLAYMTNINRNHAYAHLRDLRARHRREGKVPDGLTLAGGLVHYSARGPVYVNALKGLIRRHKLHVYDTIPLEAGGAVFIHISR